MRRLTKMNFTRNKIHVRKFEKSNKFEQLSDNQQFWAIDILASFNAIMQRDEQCDDLHWTLENVSNVMMSEFSMVYTSYNYAIAAIPVLKAYQQFLQVKDYQSIEMALTQMRKPMFELRRHFNDDIGTKEDILAETIYQLTGNEVDQQLQRQIEHDKRQWLKDLSNDVDFKQLPLNTSEKLTIADTLITRLSEEFSEVPANWDTDSFMIVVDVMMVLDPKTQNNIDQFVPVIRCLINLFSKKMIISVGQGAQLLTILSAVQPRLQEMANYSVDKRLDTMVTEFAMQRGAYISTVADMDDWLEKGDNLQLIRDFMDAIRPWLNGTIDERDPEYAGYYEKYFSDTTVTHDQKNSEASEKHQRKVIPFSKKKRKKKHKK